MPPSVRLTPLRDQDSATLYRWINDREQVLFNAAWRPVSAADHERWFRDVQSRSDRVIFAIRPADDEDLIGTCQLHDIHPIHRSAELQIRIGAPEERGRGYGTAAVVALLRFAFRDLNLNRVTLKVFHDNARAIRAYEKAGFQREGLLRSFAHIDGRYVDVVIMGVLRDEFPLD